MLVNRKSTNYGIQFVFITLYVVAPLNIN